MLQEDIKQIIVIRKDLNMRKGKMIAQGAHASQLAIFTFASNINNGRVSFELMDSNQEHTILGKWLGYNFKKIVVGATSEQELLAIYEQAQKLKLPTAIVQDSGLTEFNGIKTYTAIAIGPTKAEDLMFTSHMVLL